MIRSRSRAVSGRRSRSDFEPQSDIILRPQVNLNALWPITQLNTLRLDLGIGYSFYLDHSENNTSGVLLHISMLVRSYGRLPTHKAAQILVRAEG